MFQMNFQTPGTLSSSRLYASHPPFPAQKGVTFGSVAAGTSRAPARMGMDIANLKSSRGCSSCGK
jgi:hypothetical protein